MYKNNKRYFWLLLALLTAIPVLNIQADGSRNWATPGSNASSARRAFLRSSMLNSANWPFPNLGTHYVYAKAGERITVASSMQGVGTSGNNNKRIRLYSPTGDQITLDFTNGGRIVNRAEEVAGPRLSGVTSGGGYTPAYYLVPSGGDGVYRVEFISTYTGSNSQSGISSSINATSDWNQSPNTNNTVTIAAWDVSVIDTGNTAFIPGRVYTNVLNLSNGYSNPNTTGFYGLVYVRTKDGYTYRVNNNGNNGMYFTFFVNNNGFVDATSQLPIYKSLNTTSNLGNRVHNPNNADLDTHITHKMFYTLPATDLPATAPIAKTSNGGSNWTSGTTWLKASPIVPEVSTPLLKGVDGMVGQVSNKGGYIEFDADVQGNFKIEIISEDTPAAFSARTMTGQASAGSNRVLWDGKDGNGNSLPRGTFPVKVTVQLQGAEVHFPFFDMEYNTKGTIIELLKHESLPSQEVTSDIVYWNDVDVNNGTTGNNSARGRYSDPKNNSHLPPANSVGISSNTNGHIWGIGATGTSGQFGDNKSIDTWTFITGEKKESESQVNVKIADLEVLVTVNKPNVIIGDEIEYTAVVKNNGLSDVIDAPFTFALPPGFDPVGTPVFTGSANCTESIALVYDSETNTYRSKLNMVNGCEVTYTFKTKVTDSSDPDYTTAVAGILRPNDVTDPNATNSSDPSKPIYELPLGRTWDDLWKYPAQWPTQDDMNNFYIPPFSAEFECANRDSTETTSCNNIGNITVGLLRVSDLGIVKSVDNPSPDIGETVTFTLKVTNHGPHRAVNIVVTDIVPDGYTDIANIDNDGVLDGNTITWNIAKLENTDSKTLSFKAKVVNEGDYTNTASVTGEGEDPNLDNNESTATVVPCEELNIFKEDFGTSNFGVNFGRTTSPYMPSGSFNFGTPYPQSNDNDETAIDNDHYAVVAPGYIKAGWKPENLGWYFWTPLHNEPETVTDRSGTVDGAVMVINAGNTLQPFYERPQLLQVGATYRASFWLYLVKGDSRVSIDVKHARTGEILATITSPMLWDGVADVKSKWNYIDLYFTVPVPDDKEDCEVDNVILSFRNDYAATFGNDYYIDDISLDKVCSPPPGTVIINCPDPDYMKNYWHGTIDNDWNKTGNWTANFVPGVGEDITFATDTNNGASGDGNGEGAAVNDLYLDNVDQNDSGGRIIGDLINDSEVDLIITTGNQLIINGEVIDNDPGVGTIVVKASPDMPSGTLKFADLTKNQNVGAIVEFYNKAYDCADCGFYTRSWQYFGIPVEESEFPASEVAGNETINQWVEPFNGNKWQPAPYTPDTNLKAFKGYQITNDAEQQPEAVYGFNGTLNVGNVSVGLTQTANVNYTGVNLVGNSYTAAIPINGDAISFPTGVEQTVYLFNTGTRDQWRKLNGSAINQENYRSGQYLAVPVNVGGQNHFPDRIPSMHSFMVRVESGTGGNLEIDYSKLVKNTAVKLGDNSTEIVTRSATETTGTYSSSSSSSSASSIPSLVMDVIGEESADRVWIFAKEGTTHGFDNGWDGRKMTEGGIAQLYVTGSDNSKLQVATVPTFESIMLGFEADVDGKYTIEFALSDHWTTEELYLRDLATGTSERVAKGGSYTFQAKKGDSGTRFSLSASGTPGEDESAKIVVQATDEGKIAISNNSNRNCTISISNTAGKLLQSLEVKAGDGDEVESLPKGSYVVRIQNAVVSDARKVIVD